VLQMFERYVGPDVFRDSIREHMKRHFMATATVYDFMETLSDVAGDDRGIKPAFKSFLFQPGVPFLQIQQVCSDDTAALQIQQERFLPAGSAGDPGQSWVVPVCVAYGQNGVRSEECFLLEEDQQSVPLSGCPDWLMPNAGGAGYFRWRLEPEAMDRLFSVFLDELDTAERIAFVDSLVAGVNHGSIPLPVFFDALPVITAAAERSVLEAPINAYRYLLRAVGPGETADAIRDYALHFYLPRLAAFPSLAGSPLQAKDELLRYRLVSFLAIDLHASEVRGPLNEAVRSYLGYGTGEPPNPDSLSVSLLRSALVVAAQEGDADFIKFLMARFNESDDARFRQYVMTALAFVTDAAVVDEVRRFVLGPDIRGNELQTWLYWSLNPEAPVSAWPWVRENIDKIIEQGSGMVARKAAFTFGQWLCKSDDAALLASLFEPFVDQYPGSRRNLDRALESIGLCDTYRQIHSPSLAEYF
jgi:alanyl aminopeptidase